MSYLPTPFQRPSNPLPRGCVPTPLIPPTGRYPLEGGTPVQRKNGAAAPSAPSGRPLRLKIQVKIQAGCRPLVDPRERS